MSDAFEGPPKSAEGDGMLIVRAKVVVTVLGHRLGCTFSCEGPNSPRTLLEVFGKVLEAACLPSSMICGDEVLRLAEVRLVVDGYNNGRWRLDEGVQ
jgi:hypothetical protein